MNDNPKENQKPEPEQPAPEPKPQSRPTPKPEPVPTLNPGTRMEVPPKQPEGEEPDEDR
jgi:hypothetical protein